MGIQRDGSSRPRVPLDRERVLRAAISLADETGLEAVTMRELGRGLGVEAASLYNHIDGKDDLLDGITEIVTGEIEMPAPDVGWREAMCRRALSAREVFSRHPWLSGLIDSREQSGVAQLAYADGVLGPLIQAGFPARDAAHALLVLDSYIYGFERQRTSLSVGDDGEATESAQETVAAIPADAYPALMQVAEEFAVTPYNDTDAFSFGLETILDGLEDRLRLQRHGGRITDGSESAS